MIWIVEVLDAERQVCGWVNKMGGGICVRDRSLATGYDNKLIAERHARSATNMMTRLVELNELKEYENDSSRSRVPGGQ